MKAPAPELLALDALLTEDERRTVTVDDHLHFRKCLATDSLGRDEIDRELDEMIVVDGYNREPSSRRSDREIARVLSILDNLPRGKDADER